MSRLDREELRLGLFMDALTFHPRAEKLSQQARNTGASPGCLDSRPVGNVLLEGDGHVLHHTVLVRHENRFNICEPQLFPMAVGCDEAVRVREI